MAVGVDHDSVEIRYGFDAGEDAGHVITPRVTHFYLQQAVAVAVDLGGPLGHGRGFPQADSLVKGDLLVPRAAQELAHPQARGPAEKIPASNIKRRLGVLLAHHGGIHNVMDLLDFSRVAPHDGAGQERNNGLSGCRVAGDVRGAETALFAPSEITGVSFNTDDGAVLFAHHPMARHRERTGFEVVRLFEHVYADDLHCFSSLTGRLTTRPGTLAGPRRTSSATTP